MTALPPTRATKAPGRRAALLAGALLLPLLPAPPASAQGDADAVRGLVADRCARCHRVPGLPAPEVEGIAPPAFAEIARNPRIYTEARLRAFLERPHWPMLLRDTAMANPRQAYGESA